MVFDDIKETIKKSGNEETAVQNLVQIRDRMLIELNQGITPDKCEKLVTTLKNEYDRLFEIDEINQSLEWNKKHVEINKSVSAIFDLLDLGIEVLINLRKKRDKHLTDTVNKELKDVYVELEDLKNAVTKNRK